MPVGLWYDDSLKPVIIRDVLPDYLPPTIPRRTVKGNAMQEAGYFNTRICRGCCFDSARKIS
jgi:hypothetical protein